MLTACLLFSVMNACVFAITLIDTDLASSVISFVRILGNLFILLVPALYNRRLLDLLGDYRPSLWLRGLFGALALMLSFAGIARIGPGESAFLTASSGVFIALLGPSILRQRNSWLVWLAIIGSFIGVSLLFKPNLDSNQDLSGQAMALTAGLLTALAYLMVARAGRSNSTHTVIFYFCLMALLTHGLYFAYFGLTLPRSAQVWGLLAVIAIVGSAAQYHMTRAYQTAPAALVSAVAYLAPVLSLLWGALLFGKNPDSWVLLGSALILGFGVLLPFTSKAH